MVEESSVNRNETWWRFRDLFRSCCYSLTPVIVVGTIWSIGWARSLETRINQANLNASSVSIAGLAHPPIDAQSIPSKPAGNADQVADINAGG